MHLEFGNGNVRGSRLLGICVRRVAKAVKVADAMEPQQLSNFSEIAVGRCWSKKPFPDTIQAVDLAQSMEFTIRSRLNWRSLGRAIIIAGIARIMFRMVSSGKNAFQAGVRLDMPTEKDQHLDNESEHCLQRVAGLNAGSVPGYEEPAWREASAH